MMWDQHDQFDVMAFDVNKMRCHLLLFQGLHIYKYIYIEEIMRYQLIYSFFLFKIS